MKKTYRKFVKESKDVVKFRNNHQQIDESFDEGSSVISEEFVDNVRPRTTQLDIFKESINDSLTQIKTDIVLNEKHIKRIESYIKENYNEILSLREEIFTELEKISLGELEYNAERLEEKLNSIGEIYSQIGNKKTSKGVISEGLLNEPPSTKNSDPLTPLDQKFVTFEQLQQHYRLFVNRVQQQLATVGGGGETRLYRLDDVNRYSAKVDGMYLQYNAATKKWIGAPATYVGAPALNANIIAFSLALGS